MCVSVSRTKEVSGWSIWKANERIELPTVSRKTVPSLLALRGANACRGPAGTEMLDKSTQGGDTGGFYGNIKVNETAVAATAAMAAECASFAKMSHLACSGSGSYAQCVRWSTSIMMIDERSVCVCVCVCHFGMQNKKRNLANELLGMRSVGWWYLRAPQSMQRAARTGCRMEDSSTKVALARSPGISKAYPTAKYADGISKWLSAD